MLVRPGKRRTLARHGTAIVIEGFPRSGNTFSVAAFEVANGTQHHVGRHLHGAPHILRAARLGIPTIVLARPPRDAVLSYLIRRDTLSPDDALLEYLDFYRTALRVRGAFIVGLFDEVTTDFGAVLERVNTRFRTTFVRYEPTADNAAAAFRIVEDMNRRECAGELRETHVGRPSPQRTARKSALESLLDAPGTAALLGEADACYQRYVDLAGRQDDSSTKRTSPR